MARGLGTGKGSVRAKPLYPANLASRNVRLSRSASGRAPITLRRSLRLAPTLGRANGHMPRQSKKRWPLRWDQLGTVRERELGLLVRGSIHHDPSRVAELWQIICDTPVRVLWLKLGA